jgi:hypothetical protein
VVKRLLLLALAVPAACSPSGLPKEGSAMIPSATRSVVLPPIDADRPSLLETARFALG